MPTLVKPEFKRNASCLEEEYIRWNKVVKDNFLVHETKGACKASYIMGWKGDKGTKYFMKYEWKEGDLENHEKVLERSKQISNQKVEIKEKNTDLEFVSYFR